MLNWIRYWGNHHFHEIYNNINEIYLANIYMAPRLFLTGNLWYIIIIVTFFHRFIFSLSRQTLNFLRFRVYDSNVYCSTNGDASLEITKQWLKMAIHSVTLNHTCFKNTVVLVKTCLDSRNRYITMCHLNHLDCWPNKIPASNHESELPFGSSRAYLHSCCITGEKEACDRNANEVSSQLVVREPCFSFSVPWSPTLAIKYLPQKIPRMKPFNSQLSSRHQHIHSNKRYLMWWKPRIYNKK